MRTKKLTVGQALKFARHDFLNELQLMLLYMDLGKLPDARRTLLEATEKMRHISMLEKLRLPETEVWLSTFEWKHAVFAKTIHTNAVAGERETDDISVALYLESLILAIEQVADPAEDYTVRIAVEATSEKWSIRLAVEGRLPETLQIPEESNGFEVDTICKDEQWTFTLSGR